jgi:hypothetical protein
MTSFFALLFLITKIYQKILDFSIEIRLKFLKATIVLKVFLKTISIPTTFCCKCQENDINVQNDKLLSGHERGFCSKKRSLLVALAK